MSPFLRKVLCRFWSFSVGLRVCPVDNCPGPAMWRCGTTVCRGQRAGISSEGEGGSGQCRSDGGLVRGAVMPGGDSTAAAIPTCPVCRRRLKCCASVLHGERATFVPRGDCRMKGRCDGRGTRRGPQRTVPSLLCGSQ